MQTSHGPASHCSSRQQPPIGMHSAAPALSTQHSVPSGQQTVLPVPWQTALGAVFISGLAFIVLTLAGIRQLILAALPPELYASVAAGIGLFIALIGFRNSGIIVPNPQTTVTLGNLRDPNTLLAVFGLLLIGALMAWRVRAAMLIGILGTTAVGAAFALGVRAIAPA